MSTYAYCKKEKKYICMQHRIERLLSPAVPFPRNTITVSHIYLDFFCACTSLYIFPPPQEDHSLSE